MSLPDASGRAFGGREPVMRHAPRLTLIVALALGGTPVLPAQDVPELHRGATTLSVAHDRVSCMVAGSHPQIDATLVPEPGVQAGRVYFHSALGRQFYYVEMQREGGRFVGTLPKPSATASPVTYYVEGLGTDHSQARSPETMARVVENGSDCDDGKLAAVGQGGTPVQVFSTTGATTLPPGFTGVTSVLATTGGGAAGAGATGDFITSTAGLVLLGAGAIGVATAVVVSSGGDDPPPVSPSQ